MRPLRIVVPLTLAALFVFFAGARCVENDSVRRGADGNWHIYGELFNETDIQGDDILVQGSIFDAGGNLLATATSPACPGQLSPGKPVVYDITLPNTQNLPQPASHTINVASGTALPTPLPELEIAPAVSADKSADGHKITARFQRPPQYPGTFFACIALYDATGEVNAVLVRDQALVASGNALEIIRFVDSNLFPDAVSARVWIYLSDGTVGGSVFQPYVSPKVSLGLKIVITPQLPPIQTQ